jgi:hypothetical protein
MGRALLEEGPNKVELNVGPIPIKPAPPGLYRSPLEFFSKNSCDARWVPKRYYRKIK